MSEDAEGGPARWGPLDEHPRLLAAAGLLVVAVLLSPLFLLGVMGGIGPQAYDVLAVATGLIGAASVGLALRAAWTEDRTAGATLAVVALVVTYVNVTVWSGYWWGFDGYMDGFMEGYNMTPPGSPRG